MPCSRSPRPTRSSGSAGRASGSAVLASDSSRNASANASLEANVAVSRSGSPLPAFAVPGTSETVAALRSGHFPAALVPLSLTVRPPGPVSATNGEIDESTGELFWAFYAGAAMIEDLALTAVSEQTVATRGAGGSAAAPRKDVSARPQQGRRRSDPDKAAGDPLHEIGRGDAATAYGHRGCGRSASTRAGRNRWPSWSSSSDAGTAHTMKRGSERTLAAPFAGRSDACRHQS